MYQSWLHLFFLCVFCYVCTLLPFATLHALLVLCNLTTKGLIVGQRHRERLVHLAARRGKRAACWAHAGACCGCGAGGADCVQSRAEGLREVCCVPFQSKDAVTARVRARAVLAEVFRFTRAGRIVPLESETRADDCSSRVAGRVQVLGALAEHQNTSGPTGGAAAATPVPAANYREGGGNGPFKPAGGNAL